MPGPLCPYGRVTGMETLDKQKTKREVARLCHNRMQTLEGITKWGQKRRRLVKLLWENAVLLMWGSVGAVGYDLCAANSCVILSWGKGTIEIGLAVSLPPGTYAWIASRSGLAVRNFINVGWKQQIQIIGMRSKWYYLITLLKTLKSKQVIGQPS